MSRTRPISSSFDRRAALRLAGAAGASALLAGCGLMGGDRPTPILKGAAQPVKGGATILASGGLTGKSGHTTRGSASVQRVDGELKVVLGSDFVFDGAPDPKVAFGKDGFLPETILAALESNRGEQLYSVPTSLDVSKYNEIWIWCERFSVPLGVAKLTPAA